MSRTGDLLTLQELDSRQERDEERLAAVEASIAGDPELDQRRRQARRRQREHAAAETEARAQEAIVDGLRRRADALDRHLYDGTVGNPQELIAMQHDLAALRQRVADDEERQLEMMERAETAARAEAEARASVAARTTERGAGADQVAAEAVERRAAVERQAVERQALVDSLAPADVALYRRLRSRLRPAVVRLTGDSCGGCHMPLGNAEVRRVHAADSPVQCSTCDRIVVS